MKLKIYRNAHVYHNEDTQKYRDVVDLEDLRAKLQWISNTQSWVKRGKRLKELLAELKEAGK